MLLIQRTWSALLSDIPNVVWFIASSLFQDIATREQLLFLVSLFFYCYCTVTKIPWSENATSDSSAVVWLEYHTFLNNAQNKTRIIQTQRCHPGGLIWWFLTFYILLTPFPPWKLTSNKQQRLMSLVCLHRAQRPQKMRVGWQTSAEVFDAHSRLGVSSTAQDRRADTLLPSSHWGLSQTIYSFLTVKARTNADYSTFIFTALEEPFRVNLQLSEQFVI